MSFGIIHIPLIGLIAYLASGGAMDVLPIVILAVLTTVTATGLAFWMIWVLIRPLDRLSAGLDHYRQSGVYPDIEYGGPYRLRRLAQGIEELVELQEGKIRQLRTEANTDALTGLGNRRFLDEATSRLMRKAHLSGQWVWVVLFDVDHFKAVNDQYGHPIGDQVLQGIAEITRDQVRPYDLITRIGGEEFCFAIAHAEKGPAIEAAKRIRDALAEWRPAYLDGQQITMSFGISGGDPKVIDFDQLLNKADEELYAAKSAGRDAIAFGGRMIERAMRPVVAISTKARAANTNDARNSSTSEH